MKKILLICAISCAFALFFACSKDSANNSTPESEQTTDELIIGSWKVISNSYTHNGEPAYDWNNTIVGEYWKFCNDGTETGNLYINGYQYCTYLVTGDKLFLGRGIPEFVMADDHGNTITNHRTYTIKNISTQKLTLINEWSSDYGGEGCATIELARL